MKRKLLWMIFMLVELFLPSTLFAANTPCNTLLTPTVLSVPSENGTGSISIAAAADCTWTSNIDVSWLKYAFLSSTGGTGNGIINYIYSTNTTANSRTGKVTINGQTFSIIQAGSPCSVTIDTSIYLASSADGAGSVSVIAPSGCAWTASSNASWIGFTLLSSASGIGNGTVQYTVSANTSASSRTGTLSVNGQSLTITQVGSGVSASNLLTNADFESGTSSWTVSSRGGYPLITKGSSGTAHAGNYYAWLAGYNSAADTLQQNVIIPNDAQIAIAQFWYKISTSESSTGGALDSLSIDLINVTTSAKLTTLKTLSSLDASTSWVQSAQFDVSAYKGQTVGLRFAASTNASNPTDFLIDDVSISILSAPPAAPAISAATPGYGSAILSFSVAQGSSPSTYTATCSAPGQTTWTGSSVSSPVVVQRLTPGVAYSCTLATSNSGGISSSSAALNVTPVASTPKVDVRTYVPNAAAGSGYASYLRVINTGSVATPVFVAVVDGTSGLLGYMGQLIASLPAGGAMTFSGAQVEAALGYPVSANDRSRIRVSASASATLEAQSFLLQPGGAFNEVSGAQSGSTINVRTYIPASAASSGYTSYLRIINTGISATPVTIARINPATGVTGAPATLIASLPPGSAITYSSIQIETALGVVIGAAERPRIQIAAGASNLEVQSFLIQPGGAFTDVTAAQSGATIDVRNYVPASQAGYTSYLRIINMSASATPVTAALIDGTTGAVGSAKTIIGSLAGFGAVTLSSSQVESALGISIADSARPRIRVSSTGALLEVQSFLLQPGGAFNEMSNGRSGTAVMVRTYIPAAESGDGYTSYLRVINAGTTATPVTVALIDGTTGTQGSASTLIASLPAGAAQTFSSIQIEAAMGVAIAPGTRSRILVSGNTVLEVQSFLTQPGGAFTEVSGGQ